MNKSLFLIAAVGVGGLIFFPDQTREVAWRTVNAAGNVAADAAASAFVNVGGRVEAKRNGGTPGNNDEIARNKGGEIEGTEVRSREGERGHSPLASGRKPEFVNEHALGGASRQTSCCAH